MDDLKEARGINILESFYIFHSSPVGHCERRNKTVLSVEDLEQKGPQFMSKSCQRFSLKKPEVGQNIAVHDSSPARNFYIPSPFNFICYGSSLHFFLTLGVAKADSYAVWSRGI